jgi:uncharacterized membrane protein
VAADRDRLDQPVVPNRRLRRPSYDAEAFGQWTERVARFLGTGRFLIYQTAIILIWLVWNASHVPLPKWDPYPYPFLTLVLSLQAAYAAPLILLAQNRQDDRDRANMVEDRQAAGRNLEDTEFLARELADVRIALGEVVTRDFLRTELRDLIHELAEELSDDPDGRVSDRAVVRKKKKPRKPKPDAATDHNSTDSGLLTEPQHPDEPEESGTGVPG